MKSNETWTAAFPLFLQSNPNSCFGDGVWFWWLSLQTMRWISCSNWSKRLLRITNPGRNQTACVGRGFNHVWVPDEVFKQRASFPLSPVHLMVSLAGVYCKFPVSLRSVFFLFSRSNLYRVFRWKVRLTNMGKKIQHYGLRKKLHWELSNTTAFSISFTSLRMIEFWSRCRTAAPRVLLLALLTNAHWFSLSLGARKTETINHTKRIPRVVTSENTELHKRLPEFRPRISGKNHTR